MPALLRRGPAAGQPLTRRHRGQGLIEMAMVAMILLTLVIGIIDFGFFFYRYVQASNCVREAARRYVVERDEYVNPPPYCLDTGLTAPTVAETGDGDVLVTLSSPHDWLAIDTLIPGLGGTTISARAQMKLEEDL